MKTDVPHSFLNELVVGTHAVIALVICILVLLLFDRLVVPLVRRFVAYTGAAWDDILFSTPMLKATGFTIFAIVLHLIFPGAFATYPWLYSFFGKVCEIILVIAFVRLVDRLFVAGYDLLAQDRRIRMQPLKGLVQMLQLIALIIGIIISISIIIGRNPGIILGSLGASAAILMLVFKDTILGVVAGVQLSANDMLKKGDWIVVNGTDVNGVVQDVTLTTVKVQNFDNTIVTVPPYNLISGSFQNWRGMSESGGRRIMRSVLIDVRSVRFLTAQEVASMQEHEWFKAVTDKIDDRPVNLTAFRYYLEDFISKFALTQLEYTWMVRQLEPTVNGIPLQIYMFTTQTDWKIYEHVQADIFDHIYAMIGTFGLRIYQSPSADDILCLSDRMKGTDYPSGAFAPSSLGDPSAARPVDGGVGKEISNPHLKHE